jgi:tagatose-1,6-bisphosphate aldolase
MAEKPGQVSARALKIVTVLTQFASAILLDKQVRMGRNPCQQLV